jgi:hypothetical protein
MQNSEGLGTERNLVPIEKETATIQIEIIPREAQPLCGRIRRRSNIARGHRLAPRRFCHLRPFTHTNCQSGLRDWRSRPDRY